MDLKQRPETFCMENSQILLFQINIMIISEEPLQKYAK